MLEFYIFIYKGAKLEKCLVSRIPLCFIFMGENIIYPAPVLF